MSTSFQARTLKRKNVKGLALSSAATARPPLASQNNDSSTTSSTAGAANAGAAGSSGSGSGSSNSNSNNEVSSTTGELEIGLEFKLDLKSEDLIVLKDLGAGNGGSVSKVMHATTKVVMAKKVIRVDAKENVRKQIVRELQVGHDCKSPYIVTFYGAFQNEARDIVLCMEYMDCGSLDSIAKEFGPIRVDVLGKITESILGGLVYLYEVHRIMHRDIKPSNVLVNSRGSIKLCDFGVAGETVNSIADTFVGTSTYMAPERIQGGRYTVRSDVWSVGLTIMELAVGRFPFDYSDNNSKESGGSNGSGSSSGGGGSGGGGGGGGGGGNNSGPMGILDLLQQIVHEPAPKLPKSDAFPKILEDFIAKCLLKKPEERPTPRELYDHDLFLKAAKRTPVDLRGWAIEMMNKKNRKSYLNPPAPRSIQDLGKSLPSSSSSSTSSSVSSFHRHNPSTSSVASNSSTSAAAAAAAGLGPSMSSRGPPGMVPPKHTRMSIGGVGSAGGMKMGRSSGFSSQSHNHRQTGAASTSQQQRERERERRAQHQHQHQQQERQHHDRAMEHYYTSSQVQSQGQIPVGQPQPRKRFPSPAPVDLRIDSLSIDDRGQTSSASSQQQQPAHSSSQAGGAQIASQSSLSSSPASSQTQPQPQPSSTERNTSLRQAIANIGMSTSTTSSSPSASSSYATNLSTIDATPSSGRPMPRRQHSSTAATTAGGSGTRTGGVMGMGAADGSRLSKTLLDYDTKYPPAITTPTHVFTENASAEGVSGGVPGSSSGSGVGSGGGAGAGAVDTDYEAMMGGQSRDLQSVGVVGGVRMGSSPPFLSFMSQSKAQGQRDQQQQQQSQSQSQQSQQQQQQQQQYAATLPSRSPSDMNYNPASIPSSSISSPSQSFSTVSAPTTPYGVSSPSTQTGRAPNQSSVFDGFRRR